MKTNIIKSYFKSNKGITITSLVATIIIMLILTSIVVTNTYVGTDYKNYKLMCADVELLEDQVLIYYREYGEIPITGDAISELPETIDNTHEYYQINVNKLGDITLNYGSEDDVFILDTTTFEVYYKNGIKYNSEIYYTD